MRYITKIITAIEIIIIVNLFYLQILPHWYVANATAGDFFCLEMIGLFTYNIYDNFKSRAYDQVA